MFCDSDALATNGLSLWGIMIGTGVYLDATRTNYFERLLVDYNTTGEVARSVFQFFRYGTDWMTPVEEVHINNVYAGHSRILHCNTIHRES